jgi:asparagine synthase (glutamine-hydrolysing)
MSVQFGKCNLDGKPVSCQEFEQVSAMLAGSLHDAENFFCSDNLGIIYHGFHTVKESGLVVQPYVSPSGNVVTWDGRLDNRETLIRELSGTLSKDSDDVVIVAALYEMRGTGAFASLKGDWALSLWDARERVLVLAKDFAGTRHLYYSTDRDQITFSSILDPLILFARRALTVDEEYIAGWLSFFPAPHLTPYVGIHSVPPSSFVNLAKGTQKIARYWDFNPGKKIRYGTDAEYEEHFRIEFGESVRRRLRSNRPVLAELSGGMDSSSIVCMADSVMAHGNVDTPRLDTISYYNDMEPNWNERPYFLKVEERRKRSGCHIDVSAEDLLPFDFQSRQFLPTPGTHWRSSTADDKLTRHILSSGSRVVLSGIGGDEVTGGVPVPIPELADLLATGHLKTLAHQLRMWALNKRKPWFHLVLETLRMFCPLFLVPPRKGRQPASWLRHDFVRRQKEALLGYETRTRWIGPLPSFQENIGTINALRRQLSCDAPPLSRPYEKRYPFMDRDLLEFLFAIPREQLVRPGQRRSLMRRALASIVPDELLNRRRKAFVSRGPRRAIASQTVELAGTGREIISASIGIADPERLLDAISRAEQDPNVPIITLVRTLALETWLRGLKSLPMRNQRSLSDFSGNSRLPDSARSFSQRYSVRMD